MNPDLIAAIQIAGLSAFVAGLCLALGCIARSVVSAARHRSKARRHARNIQRRVAMRNALYRENRYAEWADIGGPLA